MDVHRGADDPVRFADLDRRSARLKRRATRIPADFPRDESGATYQTQFLRASDCADLVVLPVRQYGGSPARDPSAGGAGSAASLPDSVVGFAWSSSPSGGSQLTYATITDVILMNQRNLRNLRINPLVPSA
jgi:hypothetical protein